MDCFDKVDKVLFGLEAVFSDNSEITVTDCQITIDNNDKTANIDLDFSFGG